MYRRAHSGRFDPPGAAGPGPTRLLAAVAVLTSVAAVVSVAPPEPLPPGADPARFSAGRALGHLRVIAAAPRPLGSLHHGSVRDYLVEQLRRLDLDVEVQRASSSARVFGWIRGASVHNVVGRLRGRGEGPAVLLAAHYDTVPNSPGAADDGAGVAALLEAARALRAGPPLERDVIFLLTDAEELGLLGAMAFVAEHPWARDAFVAPNFEARGVRGRRRCSRSPATRRWPCGPSGAQIGARWATR